MDPTSRDHRELPTTAPTGSDAASPGLRLGTAPGRWLVVTAVLGSGIAFLDGTVVNVALPAVAKDLGANLAALQWVVTGYLLTLGALLVVGGSLGDLFGRRRMFVFGLIGFAASSLLCGLAPTIEVLIAMRCVQGVAAALLVPGSLAIISASFHPDDRGAAIGAWSGLAGVASAIGPFLGGWLIDSVSWRAVFLINVPLVVLTVALALRHVPETRDVEADGRIDVAGGVALVIGLGGVADALIEAPSTGWIGHAGALGLVGVVGLVSWIVIERRSSHPMVPLSVFRSRQFSGANAVTLCVYAALGATMFLLVVHLQSDLGYSALHAGASLVPVTVLMLAFSARAGRLAQRIGPRIPMTLGPLIVAGGLALFTRVAPGSSYWDATFPAVVVFGIGLTLTVAPLTTAVLAAIDDAHSGIGSAINNAVARIAGLLAIAVVPAAAGLAGTGTSLDLAHGFGRAMWIAAGLAVAGSVLACLTIRTTTPVRATTRGDLATSCQDAAVRQRA